MDRYRLIENKTNLLLAFLGRAPAWTIRSKDGLDGEVWIFGSNLNRCSLREIEPVWA